MKKFALAVSILLILIFTGAANAQESRWLHSPKMTKLKRGAVNLVTAPLEIPKQTKLQYEEGIKKTKHVSVHIFSGFVKGVAYTFGRFGSGVWDIATFNLAVPENYEPLMKPDYVYNFRWTVTRPSSIDK